MLKYLQERSFLERQTELMDTSTKRLSEQHRQKIALLEKQALQQKQQLLRGEFSVTIWCQRYVVMVRFKISTKFFMAT